MHVPRFPSLLITLALIVASLPAVGQVVTSTLPAGTNPYGIAVNAATNKIYVANENCTTAPCPGPGTVTVINGANNATTTVNVGVAPIAVVVNPLTNKIYVANDCGNDVNCASLSTVTVIDGNTNNTTTVNVGAYPYALAVNTVTNKVYVPNNCGNDPTCQETGTVTVIDANHNNSTSTIDVGYFPLSVAVNSVTNQIYVVNSCGSDSSCASIGTVTGIDGVSGNTTTYNVGYQPYYVDLDSSTNNTYVANLCGSDVTCSSIGTVTVIGSNAATVNVGYSPYNLAVDSATNKIYVPNYCGNSLNCFQTTDLGTVTVIDGANNETSTLTVGVYPFNVAVNATTNKIYVSNYCGNDLTCASAGNVSVINGATNAIFPVAVGDGPENPAVNATTNVIYVTNAADNTVSVIGGATKLQLVNVTPPCRLVDTRRDNGGGGPIPGGTFQTFNLPQLSQQKGCGDLSGAATYSLNVTLVPSSGPVSYLTIWPAAQAQPYVSTMNSDGRIKANAAIVPSGLSGGVSVFVTDTADVILDIDGYMGPSNGSTLEFYPLPPCRIADTRNTNFPQGLGPPSLAAGMERDFPVLLATSCFPEGVTPQAYSLNFTAVPPGPLGYLTVWPFGEPQPLVSTLNAPTGAVTANAAIVPAGTGGEISTFAFNNTDLVIDVNGYFAAPGQGGLSLYPTVPCRVLDTRPPLGNGAFTGVLSPPVDVLASACGVASQSQAYVFNATVVPQRGGLGYLTLWPDGQTQPFVSTLNAYDGAISSNMAIVPSGRQGKVDAFAGEGATNLILDISSFYAP